MNKKAVKITILYFLFIIIFLALDYCNIFSNITIRINSHYLSIFIGALTTIYLFLIAYYLIDKRINDNNFEMKTNKQNALYIMLYETYDECKKSIELLKDEIILKKYIVPKVNFNNTLDPIIERQKSFVFKYDSKILDFVSDGIVEKGILKEYINIKQMFNHYINLKVAFFDINDVKYKAEKKAIEVRENLKTLENEITFSVEEALTTINKKM